MTSDWTKLKETDFMTAVDHCHDIGMETQKVYIDGSATKVGASAYAGWGLWTPGNLNLNENGALTGLDQGSDRAEVRALVAALEKSPSSIGVITDNQYVRDTANYIKAGGLVRKGKHSDLWWNIIADHILKLKHIRWVKAHLKAEKTLEHCISQDN
eukprot:2033827-Heterocapsa_arctica.AAC.1